MTGSRIRAGALAAAVGLASACGPAEPRPRVHRVTIEALSFVPETLTVAVGDTVVWVNEDLVPHTVTGAAAGGPGSGELASGAEFRWVAEERTAGGGTMAYLCAYHPVMKGVVVVVD